MRIDEAGCDEAVGDVEDELDPGRVHRRQVADGGDSVTQDGDVRPPTGHPRAIDHGPAAKQQVEGCHRRDGATSRGAVVGEAWAPGAYPGQWDAYRVQEGARPRGRPAGTHQRGPFDMEAGFEPSLCYTPPSVGL